MQQNSRPITAQPPFHPLTLRMLARDDADRQRGILSEEDQAILVMILPDICGELLARRAVMRKAGA